MRAAPKRAALLLALLMAPLRSLAGQAITTAAVQGTVAGQDSVPLPNAVVEVINPATGQSWQVETSAGGRYFIGTVTIGGPYQVAVRAIGFGPVVRTGIILSIGQRYTANFFLERAAVGLPEVIVQSVADPQANHGRTGPAQLVSDSALRQLDLSREVINLADMSPQASRAPSGELAIGGQNPRYTSYLVDGGQNTDLYVGGAVAGYGLPHSISPEAVAQLQVLAAPADVRNGDFAGGAVNMVTRSGTNAWHGSVFGFVQNDALTGSAVSGAPPEGTFTSYQYGATLSGPIVRNRLQFFLNADLQHQVFPDVGPFITDTSNDGVATGIGIRYESVARFDSILTHTFGLETGGMARSNTLQPGSDLFAKLSAQAGANNQLELSDHYARTNPSSGASSEQGRYGLGSMASENTVTENALRLNWRGLFGRRWSNEMSLGYVWNQNETPSANRALITVNADDGQIVASPWNAGGNSSVMGGSTVEFTDNVTVGLGRHVVTFGTHGELLQFQDNSSLASGGEWEFANLDSLALGVPSGYARTLPGPLQVQNPVASFSTQQLGLYAQDQWAITPQVALTFGLRVDIPFLPDPGTPNPALQDSLGLESGNLPGGQPLWSPRLGFNYDIGGRGKTFLRGSAGLFSGHPPYLWIFTAYRDPETLNCTGADVPHFDALNPPTTCATGSAPVPQITVFAPGFKYPQNWKFALGLDQRLPWGLVATVDILYTYWVNQSYFTDANLTPPVGAAAGEGGRLLYGAIDSGGTAFPSRYTSAFGPVVQVSSRGGDNAFLASVQLQRQFGTGFGLSASYTYSQVEDAFSLVNFMSGNNLRVTPLDGSLADRAVTTSFFSVPHRVSIVASVGLPLRSRLSFIYQGSSQAPYTYVVSPGSDNSDIANFGDVNGDGINQLGWATGAQDIVYVPRDVRPGGDISLVTQDSTGALFPAPASTYASLDQFITSQQCLNQQRGRIMARNSCRSPWRGSLDARLAVDLPTARGQSFQFTLDVANLPGLLHLPEFAPLWTKTYRHYSFVDDLANVPLLELDGYDTARQRGIYSFDPPQLNADYQYWNLQLGVRYSF